MASGGRVSLWDRDATALDQARGALGAATDARVVDVTDAASVEAATQETVLALERIDALVCSAAITGPNTTMWDSATVLAPGLARDSTPRSQSTRNAARSSSVAYRSRAICT